MTTKMNITDDQKSLPTPSSATAKRGTTAPWWVVLGAAGVTCVAVRWSAWLGVAGNWESVRITVLFSAMLLISALATLAWKARKWPLEERWMLAITALLLAWGVQAVRGSLWERRAKEAEAEVETLQGRLSKEAQ